VDQLTISIIYMVLAFASVIAKDIQSVDDEYFGPLSYSSCVIHIEMLSGNVGQPLMFVVN
jgi:hypothetical protein